MQKAAERLRELRERYKAKSFPKGKQVVVRLSYRQLGEETGIHRQTLARMEKEGVEDMPIWMIDALAKFYGVSMAYILGYEDNIEGDKNGAKA